MDLDIEKMQADFEKFKALTGKTGKRSKKLNSLIDKLGERLVMAPSSERDEYFNSFPGGLLDHSLKILEASYNPMSNLPIGQFGHQGANCPLITDSPQGLCSQIPDDRIFTL